MSTVITEADTLNAADLEDLLGDFTNEAQERLDIVTGFLMILDGRIQDLNETIMKLQDLRNDARTMKMNLQNEKSILERSIDRHNDTESGGAVQVFVIGTTGETE